MDQDGNGEEQSAADYVFRIVYPGYRYEASKYRNTASIHKAEVAARNQNVSPFCGEHLSH